MYLLNQYGHQTVTFLATDSTSAFRKAALTLFIVLSTFYAVSAYLGATIMTSRPWDVPLFLDGAWRILHGQVPHNDFYSHLGPLVFYLPALGMYLSRPCVSSIVYGSILLSLVFGVLSFFILRARSSAFVTFLISLFIAFLVIAPRPIGDSYFQHDYAMLYNRYGEATLILLILKCFLPRSFSSTRNYVSDAIIEGFLLFLLFISKINYFLVGIIISTSSVLVGTQNRRAAITVLLSFLVWTGVFFLITRIDPQAMLNDWLIVYHAQNTSRRLEVLALKIVVFGPSIFLLLIPVFEYINGVRRTPYRKWDVWQEFVVIGVVAASGMLVLASNTQANEIPLLSAGPLIYLEKIRRQNRSLPSSSESFVIVRYAACFLVVLYFLWPTLSTDFSSLRHSFKSLLTLENLERIDAPNMTDFLLPQPNGGATEMYYEKLVNGVEILRKNAVNSGRLTTIDFTDPFSFALGLPPAKGGIINWSWGMTLNERSHPSAERVFNDATYILLPNDVEFESEFSIYKAYLNRSYHKIAGSHYWVLWKKTA
jgi:hypothetical protein